MKHFFLERLTAITILCILSLIVVFHMLVLAGVVPFQIVWGGRLTNQEQMVRFETASIIINLFMLTVVAIRAGLLKIRIKPIILTVLLWGMFGLFVLNTIGNVLAVNSFEQLVFTPLTFILALCCGYLALRKFKAGHVAN